MAGAFGANSSPGQGKDKVEASPSSRPSRLLKKMPSTQRVDTSLNGSLALTPASLHSASSLNGSPGCSSYQSSPFFTTQPQPSLSTVEILQLPDPLLSSPPHFLSNASSTSFPRQNGLTRKLSSGKRALSRLGRTTPSGTGSRRDTSSGPVARRRSDSKTSTVASYETDFPVPELPGGLGLYQSGLPDDVGSPAGFAKQVDRRAEVVAPAVPAVLVGGCTLTKMTRRKFQDKVFYLDSEGSTVSWMGTVNRKGFHIDNIRSIRHGPEAVTSWLAALEAEIDLSCHFTINYAPSQSSKETKILQLLAPTKHIRQLWVNTLNALTKHREELMSEMRGTERESVLRAHWKSELEKQGQQNECVNSDGLGLPAIANLCRRLQIHCPKSVLEDAFHAADTRGITLLDFEQFRAFVGRLRSRVDIRPLFNSLKSHGTDGISKNSFLDFLKTEQGIDVNADRSSWSETFDRFVASSDHSLPAKDDQLLMSFLAFTSFMTSKDCHVHATNTKQKLKLDRPLNEYFVSTSHNTYLIGRQVNGTSSAEPYVTALRKGCRSVEIDCWDGDNNEPRVTHGYTGTTSISFIEVIRAINRCAFEFSPYPVILSLEVHCNPIQQARMVEILNDCIDPGKLLLYPLPDHVYDLPSPEDLKYKILVKVKATNAHPSLQSFGDSAAVSRKRSTSSPVRRAAAYHASTLNSPYHAISSPSESIGSPTDQSMTPTSEEDFESDSKSITRIPTEVPPVHKTSKITPGLAALGIYMQGYSFRNPTDLKFQKFNHIYSINEHTAIAVAKNQDSKIPFEKHNTSFLCRVYPKGFRINSSNFDPNTFWRRGVQMVALNWQTFDIHMQMNYAMFAAGPDRTGYALKPEYLRQPGRFEGAVEQKLKLPHYQINFAIKVISAQQLPLLSNMERSETISPFVQVQIFSAEDAARNIAYGHGGEEVSRTNSVHGIGKPFSRRTKIVPDNGYNPQFNDLIDLSLETKYPELVFVRFVVYQSGKGSNKELAVFTAKLDSLQKGYRHLPLYNSNGEELIFSSLFCHIAKQKPRPVLHDGLPVRHNSIRALLSRSNTMDRGRQCGQTLADSDRLAAQQILNKEIESKRL